MTETVLYLLPPPLKKAVAGLPPEVLHKLEEIRVRENRPLEIGYRGEYAFVSASGAIGADGKAAYVPNREDCLRLLDALTHHSVYSFEEELRRGFITVAGGHRVGLAGRTVLERGRVRHIKEVSAFNIRIAREVPGCGLELLPQLLDSTFGTVRHTLIVSPPQHGKTTLIRDLARLLSYGEAGSGRSGKKVGIVDERSELAASVKGVPSFDVGPRTDVLDGCPKAEGMMMMIRSMSPDVLVVDEIGRSEDGTAIQEAVHAGISVIASAHGASLDDVRERPVLRELHAAGVFSRYVLLRKQNGVPAVAAVYDEAGGLQHTPVPARPARR